MFDSDRSKRNQNLGGTIFPSIAIFGLLVFGCLLAYLGGRETERREQTPASYRQAAESYAESACTGREGRALFECVYEQVEASQEQARGEQDLSAQQRAASSALAAAIVALITLIVTAIGVWFVKRTLDATLEAVRDTSKATDGVLEANAIARESNENQLRAWLKIEITIPTRMATGTPPSPRFVTELKILNIGGTPALKINYVVWVCIGYSPTSNDLSKFLQLRRKRDYIENIVQGEFEDVRAVVENGSPVPEEPVEGYVMIGCFYQTVFSHHTRETVRIFRLNDANRPDGLIDFNYPTAGLQLVPWEENPGFIN